MSLIPLVDRIIIVTGSRRDDVPVFAIEERLRALVAAADAPVVLHGAQRGVDANTNAWCLLHGVRVVGIPALFETDGKRAGHDRNRFLITNALALAAYFKLSLDHVSTEGVPGPQSVGTYNCLRQSAEFGIPSHFYKSGDWKRYTL